MTYQEILEAALSLLPAERDSSQNQQEDGHASYKGYASDNRLKHVVLREDLKQRVKLERLENVYDRKKPEFYNAIINYSLTEYITINL